MLTKEERAAIAERVLSFNEEYLCYADIYECLFGERPRYSALSEEYDKAIKSRILDLCDTSNMIELPLDKDGEVIKVGDTVYVDDDVKYKVAGYMMRGNSIEVILTTGTESVYTKESADDITHKKPGTTAVLSAQIRRAIDKGQMSAWAMAELFSVVEQLEKLSDSDD